MTALRRKLALMICPELADLPHGATKFQLPRAKNAKAASDAERLMRLDRLYTAATGVKLTPDSAPEYSGPMYEWRVTREGVKSKVIAALYSLRAARQGGVHTTTAFLAINYFSAIWPDGVKWPADIPRPTTDQRRAS